MDKGFNIYVITKTIILSLFVLFFGVIYVVFIKNDEYNPADLLETYIVETEKEFFQVNKYTGFGTYDISDSVLLKSTDSNIVTIEMFVQSEDDIEDITESETITKSITETETTVEKESYTESSKITKSTLININTATVEELDKLPKIGPSIANAILKYREKYGDFKSIDQIKNVTGIGEKIFESIKELISV